MSRPTRTERRRAQLALRFGALEAMEHRNLITESLGILTAGIGVPAAAVMVGRADAGVVAQVVRSRRPVASVMDGPAPRVVIPAPDSGGGGRAHPAPAADDSWIAPPLSPTASLPKVPARNVITVAGGAAPAPNPKGGGAGGSSHGGSGSVSPAAMIANAAPSTEASSATPSGLPVVPLTSSSTPSPASKPAAQATSAPSSNVPIAAPTSIDASPAPAGSGLGSVGGLGLSNSNALITFAHFPLYVLDQDAGSVMLPGANRLATLGGNVDLRAQVKNTTVSTYSWNTSGLTNATSITGASTYDLKFQWNTSVATATTNSVVLTVTNSSSQTQVETLTFQVPAGSGTAGTGTTTWPQSLSPDTVSPSAPAVAAHDVSVDSNSGSLGTAISLPTYNPNVPAVVLSYDSVTANPLPIVIGHHTLDPTLAIPSQVSAQLTFNGTAGSTYYYNTSQFIPGDVQQVALQVGTAPSTGRYAYSISTGDIRGTTTTTMATGSTDVINDSGSALGAGWSVDGLEKIITATGGVILDLGSGGKSLWFATGTGSTYVDPAGEFSTLVANGGGTYTRTLTDGTTIQFDSSGREIADVDTHNVAITYAYDGSGRLSTIKDHYSNTTTFVYDGTTNLLKTITDPASRIATFTHSGTALSGVTLPDSSTWGYAYNGSGQLTQVTDPNSKIVTVAYDSANRVGTISNPDATSETFVAAQERGFVPSGSGTSGSPAAATLLAESTSSFIDPLANETDLYPDWQGLGLPNVTSDPLGNISTADRDGNGLATIAVDRLNRTTQYTYDSKGNVTKSVYPDGTSSSATYNSLAEPLTKTDELSRTTSYTYDSAGNLTRTQEPLLINATTTYSGTGQPRSYSDPSGYLITTGGANQGGGLITESYDTQDRPSSREDALIHYTTYGYDPAGDVTSVKDANGNTTNSTYDGLGRLLTTTDPLSHTTTHVYDAAGNPTVVIDPLGHRTTMAYDAMNRMTTVADAGSGITTYTYDADGRQASITDSVNNLTTYAYDADGRQVGSTDPNGYRTTLTYDAAGEVTQKLDRDGRQINYGYDARGREVTEKWINGTVTLETITYTYDNAGELGQVSDGTTVLTYTYDNDGRQSGEGTSGSSGQPAVALTVAYYDSNSRASLVDNLSSVGSVSYSYDAAFRLQYVAGNQARTTFQTVTFGYDPGDRLTSLSRSPYQTGIGPPAIAFVNTSYTYDVAGRLGTITHQTAMGTALATYTYGYDNADRLTSETNAEGSVTYTYDVIDELTGVSGARAETYTYDHNGNRTMTGYTTATNNETSAGAGYTYTYDHEGNLTAKTQTSTSNVWTYAWDYRNRLTGVVEKTSGGTVLMQGTYTYDAMDRRIGVDETVSGVETKTYTVYDGVNPYADFNGSGTLLERYLYGPNANQILARTSGSGTTAWYLTDHEGTVRDIVSTSGTVIDHVAYDSYGNVTSESSPSNGDRFKFDAMAMDAAIGLYYDNVRYYDSVTGKFIIQDLIGFKGGDKNLYRYCSNNSIAFADPSGESEAGAISGGVTATVVGGVAITGAIILGAPITVPVAIGTVVFVGILGYFGGDIATGQGEPNKPGDTTVGIITGTAIGLTAPIGGVLVQSGTNGAVAIIKLIVNLF